MKPDPGLRVTPVALPSRSAVVDLYRPTHLADAFAIPLPPNASDQPERLANFMFSHLPSWAGLLMRVRDVLVSPFGLKTTRHLATLPKDSATRRIGFFKVYSTSTSEVVVGEDDTHLDFRISVFCATQAAPHHPRTLTVSTVVQCHNLLGRAYLFLIAPFHRWVVQSSLRRAARLGWPEADACDPGRPPA